MKKKLLIILGAGSSVSLGMPSVARLNELMTEWSRDWHDIDPAIPRDMDNCFTELWCNGKSWYRSPFDSQPIALTFEHVLGDMLALAQWLAPRPSGNAIRQFVCGDRPPAGLRYRFTKRYEAHNLISSQVAFLLGRLAKHMRELCKSHDPTSAAFCAYKTIFDVLRTQFDVGVYNLNYDNMALLALPGAFTGFDEGGAFDPRAVHDRREWEFVYHLHGSVHHSLDGTDFAPIRWREALHDNFKDGDEGQAINRMSDGKVFPRSTLVAGGFKLDQLLIEPFHSFYATLTRHLHQAEGILIGGYGFGDVHVNHALRNSIGARLTAGKDTRPPVVILTKAAKGEEQLDTRLDTWATEMRKTLLSEGHFACEPLDEPDPHGFAGRVPPRSFETSTVHPVRVWHGGFTEAADRLDRVGCFLSSR